MKLVLKPKTKGEIRKKLKKNNHPPKNRSMVNKLIKIIEQYSAKKNSANPMLEYSTLKPDTNSDSASGKSNGARLVSANIDIKNINNKGAKGAAKKVKY